MSWLWKEALRSGRPPTEAAYNIRIALTNTTNPVKADATQTLSNTAMVLSQRDPLTTVSDRQGCCPIPNSRSKTGQL